MRVIIVGCGRLGADLAYRLFQRGHDVTIIDQIGATFDNLHPLFRGRTVEGEVMNQDVLASCGHRARRWACGGDEFRYAECRRGTCGAHRLPRPTRGRTQLSIRAGGPCMRHSVCRQ